MRKLIILGMLALAPFGARAQQETPTPSPQPDTPTITYLGASYGLLAHCLATGFIVGINQTPIGQTDKLLIAIPFAGGVQVLPPRDVAATGPLADKQMNDAVCIDITKT